MTTCRSGRCAGLWAAWQLSEGVSGGSGAWLARASLRLALVVSARTTARLPAPAPASPTPQEIKALFLEAQARWGLGQPAQAAALVGEVLRRDPSHGAAADMQAEMRLERARGAAHALPAEPAAA